MASKGSGCCPAARCGCAGGRVPRMGWSVVEPFGDAFYFAHSYAAETPARRPGRRALVAEARAPAFIGCQFHPEKSGPAGARYLAGVLEEVSCLSPV